MVSATLRKTSAETPDPVTETSGVTVETTGSVTEVVVATPVTPTTQAVPAEDFDAALGIGDNPQETKAVARTETKAVSHFVADSDGTLEGEWGLRDIRFPTLRIVAGSGELVSRFTAGTLIFGDEELLDPPKPQKPDPKAFFRFVPLKLTRRYREVLNKEQQDAKMTPRMFDTAEEAMHAGLSTVWIGKQKPTAAPTAECMVLVEKPEGSQHPGFALEYDGKACAIAIYYAGGVAFNAFAKLIFSTMHTTLLEVQKDAEGNVQKDGRGHPIRRACMFSKWWTFRTAPRTFGEFTVITPEIKVTNDVVSQEIRDFVRGILTTQEESAS